MILTVCETCKRADYDPASGEPTDGEKLAELISTALAADDDGKNVTVRRHACLMGCSFACNVALQGEGKLTYTLGTFEPSTEAAEGILALARAFEASPTGQVPFKEWPEAIKGHFRARIPPLPSETD